MPSTGGIHSACKSLQGTPIRLNIHTKKGDNKMNKPKGLYANIYAKRKRIEAGSGEIMREPGSKGAPTEQAFRESKKTVRKRK